jgi:hypothetical protein
MTDGPTFTVVVDTRQGNTSADTIQSIRTVVSVVGRVRSPRSDSVLTAGHDLLKDTTLSDIPEASSSSGKAATSWRQPRSQFAAAINHCPDVDRLRRRGFRRPLPESGQSIPQAELDPDYLETFNYIRF